MKNLPLLLSLFLSFLPTTLFAWQWLDFWQTRDQQGSKLLQAGKLKQAAQTFENKAWRGVAYYRAQDYNQALQQFQTQKTSDGYYNAGNANAYLGEYKNAIAAYDQAIALNPNNKDAITNREIIKKLLKKQNQQNRASCPKNSSASKKEGDKNKQPEQKNSASDKQPEQNKTPKKNTEQTPEKSEQPQNPKPQPVAPQSLAASQTKEEAKQQIFRRLVEDPGGLLRRKFLRDYIRRHHEEFNQGEN